MLSTDATPGTSGVAVKELECPITMIQKPYSFGIYPYSGNLVLIP